MIALHTLTISSPDNPIHIGWPARPRAGRIALLVAAIVTLVATARPAGAQDVSRDTPQDAAIRLNEIQVLGTHNIYKTAIDAPLMRLLKLEDPAQARALDYAHPPLTEQLDAGLRSLELDVFHDPEGGRYAEPHGLTLMAEQGAAPDRPYDPDGRMEAPGFKVLHVQDIDFRTNCLTLQRCLQAVRQWSDAHPNHVPIIITMNLKDGPIDRPGFTRPLPFDRAALDALDDAVRRALGPERLITPDDVRGDYPTLEAAVRAGQWPRLDAARGRVLLVLDESGEKLARYRTGHPSLRGRALFGNFEAGTPEAAVRIVNDPLGAGTTIRRLVAEGYMVRTRADANTVEARQGDTRRRKAAFASGAHVVTTDYYRPDPSFGTGYRVALPGGPPARCNPIVRPVPCPDAFE